MKLALAGAEAAALAPRVPLPCRVFPDLSRVPEERWQLLALTPAAAAGVSAASLRAQTLLLPGGCGGALLSSLSARQVVGYGLSRRDTLTLSSLGGESALLCVQRRFAPLRGAPVEPQELALPRSLATLPGEEALLLAGIRLLCGLPLSS